MARRPPMAVTSVTIGAPAPRDLAAFYAQLPGWTVTASEPARPGMPPEDGWAQLRPPAGEDGPTLNFEYEANFTRPVWPAADGRQNATQHLDIAVADLDETVRWAIAAGAILADVQPQGTCPDHARPSRASVLPVRRRRRLASAGRAQSLN